MRALTVDDRGWRFFRAELLVFLLVAAVCWGQEQAPKSIIQTLEPRDNDLVPVLAGKTVMVKGTVTSVPISLARDAVEAWIQDDTGGISLFCSDAGPLPHIKLKRGDLVIARGRLQSYRGKEAIVVDQVTLLGHGQEIRPKSVRVSDLESEKYSGQLVEVTGSLSVSPDEYRIVDSTGSIRVQIPSRSFRDIDFLNELHQARRARIIGISSQRKQDPPYNSGYLLLPRDKSDFHFSGVIPWRIILIALGSALLAAGVTYLFHRVLSASRKAKEMEEMVQKLRTSEARTTQMAMDLRRSEAQRILAARAARTGTWVLELTSYNITCSSECKELLGIPAEAELTVEILQDRIHPDDREKVIQVVKGALQDSSDFSVEFRTEFPDGNSYWRELKGQAFADSDSNGPQLAGVVLDVHERKIRAEELRESKERLELASAAINDGIWEWDIRTNTGYWSQRWYQIIGYTPGELQPGLEAWLELIHEEDRHRVWTLEQDHLSGKTPLYECEFRMRHKDGSYRWIRARGLALRDQEGRAIKIAGSHTDLTAQKAAEEAQRLLEERYVHAQKMEAIGSLAGGVAHDFNNLLLAIGGRAEILLLQENSSRTRAGLEEIYNAVQSAASVTRQLLAFSRRQVLQPVVIRVDTSLLEITNLLRRVIGEQVTLEKNLRANDAPVRFDPAQLQQILLNLAINARDAMPDGGVLSIDTGCLSVKKGDVWASRVPPGEYVFIRVSDTGIGMSAEIKARIFEPFFTTKPREKGTGLGLSTVYGIVSQSGGEIMVDSVEGKGSSFTVFLPRVPDGELPLIHDNDEVKNQIRSGPECKGNILVIEDEEVIRSQIAEMLQQVGYFVCTAADGQEAETAARLHKFDVIISDVVLPGRNGPSVVRKILPQQPRCSVIFMSGYAETAVLSETLTELNAAFLAKPFSMHAALDLIGKCMLSRSARGTD